jgi:hypothetical protein
VNHGRVLLGFLVALVIGAGAGVGLGPLADSMAATQPGSVAPLTLVEDSVLVEVAEGRVQGLYRSGSWGPVERGTVLARPTSLRTGPESRVRVLFRGATLEARERSAVSVSAPGPVLSVLVESGLALVATGGAPITARAPTHQLSVQGKALGLMVLPERAGVAVLDGEAELSYRGARPTLFAAGRQIDVSEGEITPSVLEPRLVIEEDRTAGGSRGSRFAGRTAPAAAVWLNRGGTYSRVPISFAGLFAVDLSGPRPAPGELVAYDAAGRRAELGLPSSTIEEVLAVLREGSARRRPAAPSPAPEQPLDSGGLAGAPDSVREAETASRAADAEAEALRKLGQRTPAEGARKPSTARKETEPAETVAEPSPPLRADDRSERERGGGTPQPVQLDLGNAPPPEVKADETAKPETRLPRPHPSDVE